MLKITSDWYEDFWHRYIASRRVCLKPITYVVIVSFKHAMHSNAGHKPVQSSMHLFNHIVVYIPEDLSRSMEIQSTEACLPVPRILFDLSRLLIYSFNRTFVAGRGCWCASIYQTRFITPRWSLLVGLALPTLSGAMARCLGHRSISNSYYCIAHFVTHQLTNRAKCATQKIPDRNHSQCATQMKVEKTWWSI